MDISRPCQPEKLIPLLPWPGFDPSFSGHNDRRAITSEWTRLRLKLLSHRGCLWSYRTTLNIKYMQMCGNLIKWMYMRIYFGNYVKIWAFGNTKKMVQSKIKVSSTFLAVKRMSKSLTNKSFRFSFFYQILIFGISWRMWCNTLLAHQIIICWVHEIILVCEFKGFQNNAYKKYWYFHFIYIPTAASNLHFVVNGKYEEFVTI